MEPGKLPFSRIRCVRHDPRALSPESHRSSYLRSFRAPVYPAAARDGGVEGRVVLDVVVGRDGAVLEASARTGPPLLGEASVAAVREWQYRPTKVNGVPVEVATEAEFVFTLPDRVENS